MNTINTRHLNAVVGVLKYVDDGGVALVECDEIFETITVPVRVMNHTDAMLLVDRAVCVFDSIVYPMNDIRVPGAGPSPVEDPTLDV